jgi:DNA-binding transcriptional ArsR family regulator
MWFNTALVTSAELDRTFAALADPTRREILRRLSSGDATLTELAGRFPVSIQAVAKHLKVLEGAGLITRAQMAQLRPAHLEGAPLKQIAEWVDGYRGFWEGGFERMETRLKRASRETLSG